MCRIKGEGFGVVGFGSLGRGRLGGWKKNRSRRVGCFMGFGDCRECNGAVMLDERRRRKGEELGMLGLVVRGEDGLPPVSIVGHLNELFCCA